MKRRVSCECIWGTLYATGTSWSPLCGLKGVKPPVKFGERTWDCSPGHAGKEGPHVLECLCASIAIPACLLVSSVGVLVLLMFWPDSSTLELAGL